MNASSLLLFLALAATGGVPDAAAATLESTALSDAKTFPFYFAIPAPRGQILDQQGRCLARNSAMQRLLLHVPRQPGETADSYIQWVNDYWPTVAAAVPQAQRPEPEYLRQHFAHRRLLPLHISSLIEVETASRLQRPEHVEIQTEYGRSYPGGSLAAHVLGYVTNAGTPLRGPFLYGEPLWREVEGRSGLEASFNTRLTGQPGLMVVSYDESGARVSQQVLRAPVPGHDVVTTLNLPLQQAAEKALAASKRPGAMAVVDVATGSILALASAPTFDPGDFVRGLSQSEFESLGKDKKKPLFNRAISGLYPPGSTFKPFVGLAGLRTGRIDEYRQLPCGPELEIEGRIFRNWSDDDSGWFDLNAAIVRSCNTYFYQAAIATGAPAILATAREFGFGQPMKLPLAGVEVGELPRNVASQQGIANISIGQSPLVSSPLEVAMAMATLADGLRRPKPRLVSQVQDQAGSVVEATLPAHANSIRYPFEAMAAIHSAMYSVVNHRQGTATKARLPGLRVYGKTGTSQWARDGEAVNAVWFAGFVKDTDPPLAFAVVLEGEKGERIFGGATASPVVAQVLAAVAASPAKYAIRTRKVKAPMEDYPLGTGGSPASETEVAGMPYSPSFQPRSVARQWPRAADYPRDVRPADVARLHPGLPGGVFIPPAPGPRYHDYFVPGEPPAVVRRAVPAPPRASSPTSQQLEAAIPEQLLRQLPLEVRSYYERARSRSSSSRSVFPSRR